MTCEHSVVIDPRRSWIRIEERLETEKNPKFRGYLENMLEHIKSEVAGELEGVLATLSPVAQYAKWNVKAGEPRFVDGVKAIRSEWYESIFERISTDLEFDIVHLVVDDNCVVTEGAMKSAVRGSYLASQGLAGVEDDFETFYLQRTNHLIRWPFDDEGRLIGEHSWDGYIQPIEEVAARPLKYEEIGRYTGICLACSLQSAN